MLTLNGSMKFIRCSKYEYLVKAGSMSNYSLCVKDEDKQGIIEYLFEQIKYPASQKELVDELVSKLNHSKVKDIKNTVTRLKELEIIVHTKEKDRNQTVFILADDNCAALAKDRFSAQGYNVRGRIFSSNRNIKNYSFKSINQDYKQLSKAISKHDFIVLLSTSFSPTLFYEVNKVYLEDNKKLIIAYLDGREGVIVPLLNPVQVGCYNDFEILRESSFFNLLDYQMMKEHILRGNSNNGNYNQVHLSALIDQTLLLLEHYLKSSDINYYAYSFDFERLVNIKTKLLKFPKCPSCQSDRNLVHPFI